MNKTFFNTKIENHFENGAVCVIAKNEKVNLLAIGFLNSSSLMLRNLDTFEEYFSVINVDYNSLRCLIFSNNGEYLFTCDVFGLLTKWDVSKKLKITEINFKSMRTLSIYQNTILVSGNSEVRTFDIHSMEESKTFFVDWELINFTNVNENAKKMKILTFQKNLHSLDLESGKLIKLFQDTSVMSSIFENPLKNSFFVGNSGGIIFEISNVENKVIQQKKLSNDDTKISEIEFFREKLIVISLDMMFRILNPVDLSILYERKLPNYRFTNILNIRNEYLISCGMTNYFHVWKIIQTLKVVQILQKKKLFNIFFYF
jgi:WD40 repeat protein